MAVIGNQTIKILFIGSGYTKDFARWLWKILKSATRDQTQLYSNVIIGYGIGINQSTGNSLTTLRSNYRASGTTGEANNKYTYYKYSSSQNASETANKTFDNMLEDEIWDIVVLSQQGDYAGKLYSFMPDDENPDYNFDINELITYIKNTINNIGLKICLNATWSHAHDYSGENFRTWYEDDPQIQFNAIQSTFEKVAGHMIQCDYVVNTGLVIEYGRNNRYLRNIGVELLQDNRNMLKNGIPMYMTSMALAHILCGINVSDVAWYPTVNDDPSIDYDITPIMAEEARKCACDPAISTVGQTAVNAQNICIFKRIIPGLNRFEKSIRILGIGSSYTRDSIHWLWRILKEAGYNNVIVGGAILLDSTLRQIYNARDDSRFTYRKWETSHIYTDNSNCTLGTILSDEPWDVVVFQQQSDYAGQLWGYFTDATNPYKPDHVFNFNDFVSYVKNTIANPSLRIGLNATWSHAHGYEGNNFRVWYVGVPDIQHNAVQRTIPKVADAAIQCNFIVNTGAAVKLARQNPILSQIGIELTRNDKNHIARGIPSYMAGMVYANVICGVGVEDLEWFPTSSDLNPNDSDDIIDTPTSYYLAREARRCACAATIEQIDHVDKWVRYMPQ